MKKLRPVSVLVGVAVLLGAGSALTYAVAQQDSKEPAKRGASSYLEVVITEPFAAIKDRMEKAKPEIMSRQKHLLEDRYDLSDRSAKDVTMSDRPKPIQEGVRAKLPKGVNNWDDLAAMSPDDIREKDLFPAGFLPLPHPNHPEGGMLFPKFHIDLVKKQDGRDLTRFDLDFDLPDHFLAAFPPAVYLTTRPDLGDVSQGKLVTIENFHEIFNGILNPKQLEGLRLLLTPFPQQQFNATVDRRSEKPSQGWLVSTVMPMATPTLRRIWSATSGRKSIGAGSTPFAARRQHPAAVRLPARPPLGGRLHRI